MSGILRQGLKAAVGVCGRHKGIAQRALLFVQARSGAEIVHAPAGLGIRDAVVERFPLVGNYLGAHQFHHPLPEAIGDLYVCKGERRAEKPVVHLFFLRPCGRDRVPLLYQHNTREAIEG